MYKPYVSYYPKPRYTNESKNYTFDYVRREYVCNHIGCGKRYSLINYALRHQSIHLIGEYKCSYEGCNEIFEEKIYLNKHQKKHNDKYHCDVDGCGHKAESNSKLDAHKIIHSDDKLFKCDIDCGTKAFKHNKNLRRHRLSAHSSTLEDKPWIECTEMECDYKSRSKRSLSNHKKAHKKLVCRFCNEYFKRKITLMKHEFSHTGDTDWMFRCEWNGCEKAFARKHLLTEHLNIHTEKILHSCSRPNCDKTFINKSSFYNHLSQHKGLPYKCKHNGCEYQTTNNIRFKSHLKRHQNE